MFLERLNLIKMCIKLTLIYSEEEGWVFLEGTTKLEIHWFHKLLNLQRCMVLTLDIGVVDMVTEPWIKQAHMVILFISVFLVPGSPHNVPKLMI